jgi:hypothetical protein
MTTTITALPAASALAGTEVFPADQAGVTSKVTANQIKTFTGNSPLSVTDGSTTVAAVTSINITSGGTVSSGGAGIADVAVAGGGGGGSTGLLCNDAVPFTTTNVGWDATSIVAIVSGNFLKAAAFSSIKFKLVVGAGTTYQVGSAVVRHLPHGTTSFSASVAVTWGGVANPLLAAGANETDAITVAINKDSDLWIIVYGSPGAPNTTAALAQGALYAGSIGGSYASGDHTADATTFTLTAGGNIFGIGQVYGA